jgi:hypothetical protein
MKIDRTNKSFVAYDHSSSRGDPTRIAEESQPPRLASEIQWVPHPPNLQVGLGPISSSPPLRFLCGHSTNSVVSFCPHHTQGERKCPSTK